jgi:hypothetical protein
MHGGDEKYIQDFSQKTLKGKGHLRDTGIDVRIILKWMIKK